MMNTVEDSEQANQILTPLHQRIETFDEGQFEINEGDILTSSGIDEVFVGLPLLQDFIRVCGFLERIIICLSKTDRGDIVCRCLWTNVSDLGEFLLEEWCVCLYPLPCLAAVLARTPDMYNDDYKDERQDIQFQLEIID